MPISMLLFLALFGAILLIFAAFDRKRGRRQTASIGAKPALVSGAVLVIISVIAAKVLPINGHGISLLLIYPIYLGVAVGVILLLVSVSRLRDRS